MFDEAAKMALDAYRSFLPTLFIVSETKLSDMSEVPATAYNCSEINNIAITVERAAGEKCLRCWNWSVSVGKQETYPDLCHRCCEVLTV